jgi:hypothetical protein
MNVIEKIEKRAKYFVNPDGKTRLVVLELTLNEHNQLLRLAKLGQAALDLAHTTYGINDICSREMFAEDEDCKACFSYKFCKLRKELTP